MTAQRMTAINPRMFRDRKFFGMPAMIDEVVRAFCREVSPSNMPAYVEVRPDGGTVRECFFNVRSKVEQNGGTILYGWAIWEWRPVSIEAEHHAIWNGPDGTLLDVTPHEPPCDRVLFLHDPGRVYDFDTLQRLPLIRRSLGVIPEAQAFINATQAVTDFIEVHSVGRKVTMPRDRFRMLQEAQIQAQGQVIDSLARRTGPNDPCVCNSGRKYKRCCRQFVSLGY